MKRKQLPHYNTILEIADFLHQPQSLILEWFTRNGVLITFGCRDGRNHGSERYLGKWELMLENIDPDELPSCPCQLVRPAEAFRNSRRKREEHKANLEIILRSLPPKTAARLRAEP